MVPCDAGLPPSVFFMVQGAADTEAALIDHPDVTNVTLKGSVEIDKIVLAHSLNDLKKARWSSAGNHRSNIPVSARRPTVS